ncbi:MFS transporter [Acinetobacter schindleri]|uniref:MFS transporter n=1 Tax=Acinetobacter schindleri TaxID=108981 RepID=UPI002DBD679A|nr:MFS transporter [Acinetobacter schindleri]MEB5930533.1 MFS transporter [Acinetobacter schindleri]
MQIIQPQHIIDREKLSPFQWMVFAFGFLVFFCDGLDTGIIGFIAPKLIEDWGISKPALAPVMSAALVGMCLGALFSGPLADKFGRKGLIVTTCILFSVFTILCGFASTTHELMLYRFITGLGLGAAMPNISTLVSEYMPVKRKAFLTGLAGCGFMLGISFGGVLSAYLLDHFGWEIVIMIGGIIPLVLAVILFMKLPESVQYLVKINQHERARVILSQIEGQLLNPTAKLSLGESQTEIIENPVKMLWAGYRWNSISLWACCFTSLLVFYLLTSWMPTILKTAGLSTQQFSLITAIFPFGGVIGAIIMGWYMDKINPTKVVKYAYLIAVLFFIIAGLVHSNVLLLGITIFLIGALLVGAQSSLLPLAAMTYPTSCRAVGVSWMHGIGRTGAILGAFYGSLIFSYELGLAQIFFVLAIPTAISFFALLAKVMYENHQVTLKVEPITQLEIS